MKRVPPRQLHQQPTQHFAPQVVRAGLQWHVPPYWSSNEVEFL